MQTTIKAYSYKDTVRIDEYLLEYRNTVDYRHIFASKEWILSFLKAYEPERNFLVKSEKSRNYFSLSALDSELVFTGDPFNDFNSVFVSDDGEQYDFREIIRYFSELGYRIKWINLFEPSFFEELSKIAGTAWKEGVVCLKIIRNIETQNYDNVVSKRIRQIYDRFSESLTFYRAFGSEINSNPIILENLLSMRQRKLINKKKEEYNLSFEHKFNEFIASLINFNSLWENIFIDYCVNKDIGEIMASSLNFVKDKNIICYLRAHTQSENKISYGLILDYWSNSKNFHDGIKIVDLTRGDEPYKFRLGAKEYKLNNFVTI